MTRRTARRCPATAAPAPVDSPYRTPRARIPPLAGAWLAGLLAGSASCPPPDAPEDPGTPSDDDTSPPDEGCGVDDPECVDWRYVTDAHGRALFLHGLNTDGDAKAGGLPSITREEVLALASESGFNHARYLVFWSQIEPQPGAYDDAYLDEVLERLDWFAEAGIHVVVDMHQDCWGDSIYQLATGDPDYGGVNGAPVWATITDGEPHDQLEGFWSLCYLSSDVIRAFDNFWDASAHPELQDAYAAMWAHVASRLGDHAAVLGYDLMNEPWEGSHVTDQEAFDTTLYADFLRRVVGAIRGVDPDRWIFYEPRAFGPNQGGPSWLPPLEDPRSGPPRLAYYPHFYPIAYETGYDPSADGYIDAWEDFRAAEAEELRTPLLVGEYSVLPFETEGDRAAYFSRMNAMLERTTSGWAFWDRSVAGQTQDGGSTRVLDYLVRPYARAVAGQPVEAAYDEDSGTFTLVFESRAKVRGATEVFVPAALYPAGPTVQVDDPEGSYTATWDDSGQVLTLEVDPSIPQHTVRVLR
ncbi:cellulase family glycosylhydrolase [Myxococcota bacterium]|nr:cellulase family glycosylhydrolase [Myxococcota bacterium]